MDFANILFWNVRGLNATARQDAVRSLVDSSRCDIVCLQETKMDDVSRFLVLQMLGPRFSNFAVLPSVSQWRHLRGREFSNQRGFFA